MITARAASPASVTGADLKGLIVQVTFELGPLQGTYPACPTETIANDRNSGYTATVKTLQPSVAGFTAQGPGGGSIEWPTNVPPWEIWTMAIPGYQLVGPDGQL